MRASSPSALMLARKELPANLPANFAATEESIRRLIRLHLPHGTKEQLADRIGITKAQLSRQLSGDEGLHDKTVNAALEFLPDAVVGAIHAMRCGATPDFEEKTALIIRFKPGQLFLPGIFS